MIKKQALLENGFIEFQNDSDILEITHREKHFKPFGLWLNGELIKSAKAFKTIEKTALPMIEANNLSEL